MESLFEALANAADGAFVIDENQRIVYWNQAAQEILGYTSEEVAGRACYEILEGRGDTGQSICGYHCYVAAIAATGGPVTSYDTRVHTNSGESRWISVSILSFPASDNSNPLIVHLFRDATQKRQSEQFTRQVMEAAQQVRASSISLPPLPVPSNSPVQDLTDREREVLSLLAQGQSTGDIAQALSISHSTARNHIQNILHKLNVHSRLEAVAYAYEHGLV
jgi:PAS domain S-box-containing protein